MTIRGPSRLRGHARAMARRGSGSWSLGHHGDPDECRRRAIVTPKLYLITVPGLEITSDWRLVHDRLLDEFSEVTDVLPTTMKGTILILYGGPPRADAWLETVSETILKFRRVSSPRHPETPADDRLYVRNNRTVT
jgi:hypothetical protein